MIHKDFNEPTSSWCYLDANGEVLFHVARYDPPTGRKQFVPWSWHTSRRRWVAKAFPSPRPLYGLDLLKSHPDKPVLVVEGERTAEAARLIAGHVYVVVTWAGGSKAHAQTDWSPIHGRKILIWPDADEPGIKAANEIAASLYEHSPEIKIINPDRDDGSDAADFEGTFKDFVQWAKPLAHKYAPKSSQVPEPSPANQPAMSSAVIEGDMPHKSHNGKPLSTIENLQYILDSLGVVVRYNVISKEEEIIIPDSTFSIDNKANASLAWIISWCSRVRMPVGNVGDYISYLADQNLYNPVAVWIQSKPWDGVSRLEDLYATVTAKEEDGDPVVLNLKKTLIRRWLLSAVAAAFKPDGVSAHGVLVFQGAQYVGKTQWFKRLVPRDLPVLADGMILRPDDRDSVKQVVSFWLVELGELDATFRKSDIAQLKAFLTKEKDVLRRAYAKKESEYARRTVFFASVNPAEFFHDETGNRRYWTIECEKIDYNHTVDMQQLWAEVFELYKQGESWYLLPKEMALLNAHNEGFLSKDPIEERIAQEMTWDINESQWVWKSGTEILLGLGYTKPTQSDKKKAASELQKRNAGRRKKTNGVWVYFVPPSQSIRPDYLPYAP